MKYGDKIYLQARGMDKRYLQMANGNGAWHHHASTDDPNTDGGATFQWTIRSLKTGVDPKNGQCVVDVQEIYIENVSTNGMYWVEALDQQIV